MVHLVDSVLLGYYIAKEIPLEAEDEIYVKCSGLTVEYDNPLDASTTKESVTTGPSNDNNIPTMNFSFIEIKECW